MYSRNYQINGEKFMKIAETGHFKNLLPIKPLASGM